jgi:hypothetical protein
MNDDLRALINGNLSRSLDCFGLGAMNARQSAVTFPSHAPFSFYWNNMVVLSPNSSSLQSLLSL